MRLIVPEPIEHHERRHRGVRGAVVVDVNLHLLAESHDVGNGAEAEDVELEGRPTRNASHPDDRNRMM